MPLRTYRFTVPPELAKTRLDEAIVRLFSNEKTLSKAQARKLIVAGAVYLNRKRVRIASKELIVGAHLEVHVDWQKLATAPQRADQGVKWSMSESSILFEDDWLIVVDKPPGIPTQPTLDEARANLYAKVHTFLKERERNPKAYLGLHHRLDRDTSGVILFTKHQEANKGVSEMFTQHLAQKEYRALVTGPWKEAAAGSSWEVRNYLKRAPGKASFFQSVRSGGDWAHTTFEGPVDHEVICWPRTGRTHQIRVHLSEAGYPIVGDPLYEARWSDQIRQNFSIRYCSELRHIRLMLHAACLTFPHPISRKEISVKSPIPKDFQTCKARLLAAH
ncbi:MAG: RluA family pseudouridine synthase [Bdellovibrionales bacterium]|nr:RluA family pseudouridine synthase [Bdellovibrionales bacterium]